MDGHGKVWWGMVGFGVVGYGKELVTVDRALAIVLLRVLRHGLLSRGWARRGAALYWKQSVEDWQQSFSECYGEARLDPQGRGKAGHGTGSSRLGIHRVPLRVLGAVWHGMEWRGEVWQGKG